MKIEIPAGFSIYKAVELAKLKARENRLGEVSFDFNGINLVVSRESLDLDIATIYRLECKLRQK